MSRLTLVPLIAGYLEHHCNLDADYHRQFVSNEANRIAAKIRDTFGRFDESNVEKCASLIRVVMAKEWPKDKPAQTKVDPQAERKRWENKVLAEAKARKERDERLRQWFESF